MATLPIDIDANLVVRIGRDAVRLSPSQGFRVAEKLMQQSVRQMVIEAALGVEKPKRHVSSRRRAN
jgi:hypothetical protein